MGLVLSLTELLDLDALAQEGLDRAQRCLEDTGEPIESTMACALVSIAASLRILAATEVRRAAATSDSAVSP